MARPQLVAVDTNVLLLLAGRDEDTQDAWKTIRERMNPMQFLVTPTVYEEMAYKAESEPDLELRGLAKKALLELRSRWESQPVVLNAVQEVTVSQSAAELWHSGMLPHEERNDAFVLAEAAVLGCILLMTYDSHLRDLDFQRLGLLCREMEIMVPIIATPSEVVKKFYR